MYKRGKKTKQNKNIKQVQSNRLEGPDDIAAATQRCVTRARVTLRRCGLLCICASVLFRFVSFFYSGTTLTVAADGDSDDGAAAAAGALTSIASATWERGKEEMKSQKLKNK
jgi:hypothetical protein